MTMLDPLHAMTQASAVTADRETTAAHTDRVAGQELKATNGNRPEHRADQPVESAAWSGDWLRLCHELRTPLNAILGNIELLLDGSAGPLSAPARACIGDIQVASRQLMDQLQPLLLLVQARTGEASEAQLPLDLLELIRRASADRDAADRPAESRRAPAIMSEHTRLMIPGNPVWLGALAAALVELHAGATGAVEAMSVEFEPDRHQDKGVRIFISWEGFDPCGLPPLSVALVDAVLRLHAGQIRSLTEMGLCLDLPTGRIEQITTTAKSAADRAASLR